MTKFWVILLRRHSKNTPRRFLRFGGGFAGVVGGDERHTVPCVERAVVGSLAHRVEHEGVVDEVAAAEGVVDVDAGAGHVEEDVVGPGGVLGV